MLIKYTLAIFIVCLKPAGVLSQSDISNDDNNMVSLLSKQINSVIYPLHRLDRNVGGIMVFALTKQAAQKLSQEISNNKFNKEYLAVVHNCPENKNGVLKDYLFKDSRKNKSFTVKKIRKGVKEASLEYTCLESINNDSGIITLIKIKLHTGRTHQIRVQFSSRKMPLLGDGKYGSRDNKCNTALWSYKISFFHPVTQEKMTFSCLPPKEYPFNLFNKEV